MMRVLTIVLSTCLAACSTAPKADDPLAGVRNGQWTAKQRAEAADRAWADAAADAQLLALTRRSFMEVFVEPREPGAVRAHLFKKLAADSDPAGLEETRKAARMILPRESKALVAEAIASTAADKGWTDFAPALIRSWSQPSRDVPDDKRPERAAIEKLFPGRPVAEVVAEQFLRPHPVEVVKELDMRERTRADAWDLLSRLDPDGDVRLRLLSAPASPEDEKDPLLADLRAGLNDLRVLPFTGEEFGWLRSLRRSKDARVVSWLAAARAAIAQVPTDKARVLGMRHAEPIRWAAANKPQWLAMSRDELIREIEARQSSRPIVERTQGYSDVNKRLPERVSYWGGLMSWADALAVLAVDEAVNSPQIAHVFFDQAELDRADKTTEYGGLLFSNDAGGQQATGFVAIPFPPRGGQRMGDNEFVASEDMVRAGDRALAHFHLHVQRTRNDEYAGPSVGDLIYAARSGRAQVVVTSIGPGRLNVDYYQPNGVIIDLGVITASP